MSSHPEVFSGGVLHVTVHHVYYPVTEETLQQVFVAYGVVKTSVFQRINHVEAVVQLRSRHGAARALALHGRCIYERACLLDIQDVSLEYNMHLCSLLELKQTATVAEYTTAFWERVHRVLDLNSDLNIKCFVDQYVNGLCNDIQAAVRSRSPSSITSASCLARIREDEIVKDMARGADKLSRSYGLTPTETLTDVFPDRAPPAQYRAGHDITTIDVSCLADPTPTTCSTECPSHAATAATAALTSTASPTSFPTTIEVFHELDAPVARDKAKDINTVSGVPPPLPWQSFLRDGDGERLTSSCRATQGIWPRLQPKPPWLYSAQALWSKGPRCWEILYIIGKLKLLASCWKLASPELPLYRNDWLLGYSVTDWVIQKNWDPGVMLQLDSAPLGFLRCCCLPWEQLSFHKISSVCKTTYTAAHQWDPGILVGILHVPYLPCFQRVCMFGSITANTYAYCWKGPQITEIGTVDTCSLLSVPDGLFRKAAAHSCKDDHKDGSYYQYEVRHNTSFITPFLPACVVFSMVNQLWHSSCLFSIAPWKSWRRYGSGALLGFQTNASMQALVDARRGTCVELRLLVGSWPSCYGTGVQLNQQTAEIRNLNNEQLVEVTLLINNLDMVELAYSSPRLQMFIGMSLTRMIWSLAWLSNYHGEFVHTDCRMIKASKYKMEEQQKLGGIGLHSCSPHSAWLPNNIGAQYKKHNAEDTALVLGHEQNTTAFVVLDAHPQWDPGRFLSTICGDNKTNHLERRGCRG